MDWVRENLFWIVVAVLFIWMHTKMHAGHGGHGRHGGHGNGEHGGCGGGDHGRHEEQRSHGPEARGRTLSGRGSRT